MRTGAILYAAAITVCFFIFFPVLTAAQPGRYWKGSRGWGSGTRYCRMYDPATVETISGTVKDVQEIVPLRGMSSGVHLQVRTDDGTLPVHLGPEWFLENQDMGIEPGDSVVVTGSRITFDNAPAIIAAEVRTGDDVLVLRDESGVPVWSGWRRRGRGRVR